MEKKRNQEFKIMRNKRKTITISMMMMMIMMMMMMMTMMMMMMMMMMMIVPLTPSTQQALNVPLRPVSDSAPCTPRALAPVLRIDSDSRAAPKPMRPAPCEPPTAPHRPMPSPRRLDHRPTRDHLAHCAAETPPPPPL